MFYYLSKIIGLFLNPIVWVSILFSLGLLSKNTKLKKRLIIAGFATLMLFSNSFVFNEIVRNWEIDATEQTSINNTYDYGIVLTGMVNYNHDLSRFNFMRSSDRIWQAVKLYHEDKINKILITGGSASLFSQDTVESALLEKFLKTTGIPSEDIITEEKSRNTRENALFTAQLLNNKEYQNLLLITSAMHMRRSNLCFKKVNLTCDLYPTDHYANARNFNIGTLFIPSAQTLNDWQALFHEIFGIISYKIAGYI